MKGINRSYSILSTNEFIQIFNNISRVLYNCIVKSDFTAERWTVHDHKFINDVVNEFDIKYNVDFMFYIPSNMQADKIKNFPTPASITQIIVFVDDNYGTADVKFRPGIFSDSDSTLVCIIPSKIILDSDPGDFYREVDIMYSLFMGIMENTFNLPYKTMERISDYMSRLLYDSDEKPRRCVKVALDNANEILDMSANYVKISNVKRFKTTLSDLIYAEEEVEDR